MSTATQISTAEINAALGDVSTMTDPALLLSILMGHEGGMEDALERYESFGTEWCWAEEAQQVAERLQAHYDREHPAHSFVFGFDSDSDGDFHAYDVGIYLGPTVGAYLSVNRDVKALYRVSPEFTGLRAAIEMVDILDEDYRWVLDLAARCGLLPARSAVHA